MSVPNDSLDDFAIQCRLPSATSAGVVFVHGWNGRGRDDRDRQLALAARGFGALTFDQRGHGATSDEHDTVTRPESLADLRTVVDHFCGYAAVDADRLCLVGFSYGAYLAALLVERRPVRCLVLRSMALYPDRGWDAPKEALARRRALRAWRERPHDAGDNAALAALSRYTGDVLLVDAGADEVLPAAVGESVAASLQRARSVERQVLAGADHALGDPDQQARYTAIVTDWVARRL